MRRHRYDDDTLEPLPVDGEDGALVDPEPAAPDVRMGDMVEHARDVVDAARDVLGEAAQIRVLSPWTRADAEPSAAAARAARFSSSFTRMTRLHPAQLADLPNWWQRSAHGERRVRVARRLVLEEPHSVPSGAWQMRGRLRSPWLRRPIPFELLLWPRLDAWTKLSLEPQRRVHLGRRYFRKGHRALDQLTAQLIGELHP